MAGAGKIKQNINNIETFVFVATEVISGTSINCFDYLVRFLVRCIFVVVLIGVLRASFTFERNFFERDSLYYDVDLVACVVDGDSTACKRLH